jgi:hypothetical protein
VPTPSRAQINPARLALLVAIPVGLLAAGLVWLLAPRLSSGGSGESLGPVRVAPPAQDDATAQPCAALTARLPEALGGFHQRRVTPASEQVLAWGSPAVVLRCGTTPPDEPAITVLGINGVEWVTSRHAGTTLWRSVSLQVPVEVTIPDRYRDTASTRLLNPLAAPLLEALGSAPAP